MDSIPVMIIIVICYECDDYAMINTAEYLMK